MYLRMIIHERWTEKLFSLKLPSVCGRLKRLTRDFGASSLCPRVAHVTSISLLVWNLLMFCIICSRCQCQCQHPLPMSLSNHLKKPYLRTRGKAKGRGIVPQALLHLGAVARTRKGNAVCFNYNLKRCDVRGNKCEKGLHICAVKGCHEADPPNRRSLFELDFLKPLEICRLDFLTS